MTQTNYSAQFKNLLAELFMLEQADLDFGIYRVMNARRAEIARFLDADLLPQIHAELLKNQIGNRTQIEQALNEAIEQARELGVPQPSETPKARELREKLNSTIDLPQAEAQVFNHLYRFFSRYYQSGDFLSLRRYKRDVYAMPYEGEEVKLHWANADQYYIKSSEYFRDYTFTTSDKRTVHFRLAAADTEQNNNKANGERTRLFMLAGETDFLKIENGELIINFVYQPDAANRKQDEINPETVTKVFDALGAVAPAPTRKPGGASRGRKKKEAEDVVPPEAVTEDAATPTELMLWAKELMRPLGTNGNPERTMLEKHLKDYTAKNSFDYFIHKDLNRFLRRELDFYIKNEVMFLDDIERETAPRVENYLAVMRAIRKVGLKIIEFLAQLEDFQKRLWLKKKFVVETSWCVTLDRVPREFYTEIAANDRQRAEWVRLFAIDKLQGDLHDAPYSEPLSVGFLEAQPSLVVDTSLFEADFTERLLGHESFADLDAGTDGVLIESENFQALNLLQARYRERIKCIYIDPPYNAKSSEILYKNNYKHSSWLSLMENRLSLGNRLLKSDGVFTIAVDENEQERLGLLLGDMFPTHSKTCVTVVHNPGGIQGTNFSYAHEYAYFVFPSDGKYIGTIEREDSDIVPLRDWGGEESKRETARNCFYPIYAMNSEVIDFGDVCAEDFHPEQAVFEREDGMTVIYPIDSTGVERKWRFARQSVESIKNQLSCDEVNGEKVIRRHKSVYRFKTIWTDKKYNSNAYGAKLLGNILGGNAFSFPKSVFTVSDSIHAVTQEQKQSLILDFFAGSGTTAHACLNLNREDGGGRKFILVEMGEYFHAVTKPRVLKVIYSKDWRDGKPVSRIGSSCLVKILRLESYEDTLNNLRVARTAEQADLLAAHDAFREDYTLRYLFERETADSPSLLNLDAFENPFDYRLDISERGSSSARTRTTVDLIETFNYLLGLHVTRRRTLDDFRVIEGITAEGQNTLIIWRNTRTQDNDTLNGFFLSQDFGAHNFDFVYANGDHTLGSRQRDGATWQPRMIEMDFKRLMFEETA